MRWLTYLGLVALGRAGPCALDEELYGGVSVTQVGLHIFGEYRPMGGGGWTSGGVVLRGGVDPRVGGPKGEGVDPRGGGPQGGWSSGGVDLRGGWTSGGVDLRGVDLRGGGPQGGWTSGGVDGHGYPP